jgi:hypothetical protein
MSTKILIFDLEISPTLAYTWGLWKQNIGIEQIQEDWFIMSAAGKWIDNDEVYYEDCRDSLFDDRKIVFNLHTMLDKADIVIAHNAIKFDIKKINSRFLHHNLLPPSPYKVVDTLQVAKSTFGFVSNKLAYLTDRLTEEKKTDHAKFAGFKLWQECLKGNEEAWEEMKAYNIQDVISLEELYLKFRPWIKNHPVAYRPTSEERVCISCGSTNLVKRGYARLTTGKYERFSCKDCGKHQRGTKMVNDKEERANATVNIQ